MSSRARTPGITALAAALAIAYALLWFLTQPRYGMTWDEGFYYPAYRDTSVWIGEAMVNPAGAFSSAGIEFGWQRIHELPPVTKWLGAFFYSMAPLGSDLLSIRLFSFALFGLTIALIVDTARKFTTLPLAVLTGAAYMLHPQLFGHAHVAASETPFGFLVALAIYIASGDLTRWKRRIGLAVVVGFALATKVNGLILFVGVACWLVSRYWLCIREETIRWKQDLLTLLIVILVAPVVAFAVWPWMWDDTAERLSEYYYFFSQHIHYGVWYLGEKWVLPPGNQLPVPWHYPLVMTVVSSPEIYLLLVGACAVAVIRSTILRRRFDSFDLLLVPLIVGPYAAAMLPGAPRYDGLRLFLPAFVPMTLLIARAGAHPTLIAAVESEADVEPQAAVGARDMRKKVLEFVLELTLVLGVTTLPFLGSGLSYYNLATRGLTRGGADFPFETTYWMDAVTPEVFEEINALLGPGEIRVRPMAMNSAVLQIQRNWGDIPPNITFPRDPPYDAHLIQNRKGFWAGSEWAIYANREPLALWPAESKNPKAFLFDGRPPGAP